MVWDNVIEDTIFDINLIGLMTLGGSDSYLPLFDWNSGWTARVRIVGPAVLNVPPSPLCVSLSSSIA
jgi:hypothetical protein